ncbi:DUF6233 domain-containing protein [Streptomyces sp. NPDC057486]|uniref:DUF6233 domain-containing protein n=1 Tax=Streptomyces sp. NPDC057486 TaxID=3346145 RepID=UPI003685EE84
MYDLPPDLPRLRTLEQQLTIWLGRVRQAIAAAEPQERAPRPGEKPREQGKPQVKERPPRTPVWGITEVDVGSPRGEVHRGDCFAAGKQLRAVSREEAAARLADGTSACEVCRPDLVLGAPG